MENKFENNSSEEEKFNPQDLYRFGKLLTSSYGIGELSLDRASLAEKIGINSGTLKKWEEGEAVPKKDLLPRIAKVSGKDIKKLIEALDAYTTARRLEIKLKHKLRYPASPIGKDDHFENETVPTHFGGRQGGVHKG